MPTRIYAPNSSNPSTSDWQSPSSISIYNSGWNTVKVIYRYNLGTWNVVYPDPITPSYNIGSYGWQGKDPTNIYLQFTTINAESAVVYLYNSSTPSGTPIQTQTPAPNIQGTTSYWYTSFDVTTQGSYSTKVVIKSITENETVFYPGAISIVYPTVSVTTAGTNDNTDIYATWSSTNQGRFWIEIYRASDNQYLQSTPVIASSAQSYSGVLSQPLLANTNYILVLNVQDPLYSVTIRASKPFTSAANPTATVDVTSVTQSCNSLTANWVNTNVSSGQIRLLKITGYQQSMPVWGTQEIFNFTPPTNSKTFTGLLSYDPNSATQGRYRFEADGVNISGDTGPTDYFDTQTLQSGSLPPSNFTAVSTTYGNGATFSWTAPATGPCITSNDGYTIQYKLSSDTNWSLVSNTISNTSTTFSTATAGITLTANTSYDFRIFTRSSPSNSTYAYYSITTNNTPYSISMYTLPIASTTFGTVTVYAQLKNINGANVTNNGVTVTFSATAGRGSFSSTTANTSSGLASVSYTTNSTTGNINFSSTASGVPFGGSVTLVVGLSPALTPALSVTRTNFGYDVSHTNYNSLWSYSVDVAPWSGSVNSTAFGYFIWVQALNSATITQDTNNVYCSTVNFNYVPSLTATVTSTRDGYNPGSASVSGQPATGYTAYLSYDWYYYSGGQWVSWGSGQTRGKGSTYTTSIKGKPLICNVTAARNVGGTNYGLVTIASNSMTAN